MYTICFSIENITKYALTGEIVKRNKIYKICKKIIFDSWYYDTDFYNIDEVGDNILLISIYIGL